MSLPGIIRQGLNPIGLLKTDPIRRYRTGSVPPAAFPAQKTSQPARLPGFTRR